MTDITDMILEGPQSGLIGGAIIGIIMVTFLHAPDITIVLLALTGWAITSGIAGTILEQIT